MKEDIFKQTEICVPKAAKQRHLLTETQRKSMTFNLFFSSSKIEF